jgi:hypothetical protein
MESAAISTSTRVQRQLPSRYLRKRLVALEKLFPPPQSYAVFPEQLQS